MKRLFLAAVIAAAMMVSGSGASAQVRFGVLGGFTSSETQVKDFRTSSVSLYHAGVAVKIPLVFGFAVQPQLMYQAKGTTLDVVKTGGLQFDTKVGYLEMPVQVQWGPDLLLFRPYVFGEPFVGYGINMASKLNDNTLSTDFEDSFINRLEYGFGLGAGIEIWRLQLSAKYFWNFGPLTEEGKNLFGTFEDKVSESVTDGRSFNGISVSLALFF